MKSMLLLLILAPGFWLLTPVLNLHSELRKVMSWFF
jgi:hypothetical protein